MANKNQKFNKDIVAVEHKMCYNKYRRARCDETLLKNTINGGIYYGTY